MGVRTVEEICAAISASESFHGLYEDVLADAIKDAGYLPILAAHGTDAVQRIKMRAAIQQASVVLLDMRGEKWFAHYAAGICYAVGVPTVLLVEDQLDLSDGFCDYPSVQITQAQDDAGWAKKISPLVHEALAAVRTKIAGKPSGEQHAGDVNGARREAPSPSGGNGYTLAEAEELVVEFLRDGLSEDAIRRLLMSAGFPPSWVEFRLRRRPGW
jgi:hypothetical protein